MKNKRFTIFFVSLAVMLSAGAFASERWSFGQDARARLLSDAEMPDQAALEIQMETGWHSYWRVPGDSGLPPRFEWEGSDNIADVQIDYPAPQAIAESGLVVYGYKDDFTLPLTITRKDKAAPASLNLTAHIMVCKDICVPESLTLTTDFDGNSKALIERAQKKVPHAGDHPSLKIENVIITADNIVLSVFAQKGAEKLGLVTAMGSYGLTAAPEITSDQKDPRKAFIKISSPPDIEDLQKQSAGQELRFVLSDGTTTIEKTYRF